MKASHSFRGFHLWLFGAIGLADHHGSQSMCQKRAVYHVANQKAEKKGMPMLRVGFLLYPFLFNLSLAHEMLLPTLWMCLPLSGDIPETPSQIDPELQAVLKPIKVKDHVSKENTSLKQLIDV